MPFKFSSFVLCGGDGATIEESWISESTDGFQIAQTAVDSVLVKNNLFLVYKDLHVAGYFSLIHFFLTNIPMMTFTPIFNYFFYIIILLLTYHSLRDVKL